MKLRPNLSVRKPEEQLTNEHHWYIDNWQIPCQEEHKLDNVPFSRPDKRDLDQPSVNLSHKGSQAMSNLQLQGVEVVADLLRYESYSLNHGSVTGGLTSKVKLTTGGLGNNSDHSSRSRNSASWRIPDIYCHARCK